MTSRAGVNGLHPKGSKGNGRGGPTRCDALRPSGCLAGCNRAAAPGWDEPGFPPRSHAPGAGP